MTTITQEIPEADEALLAEAIPEDVKRGVVRSGTGFCAYVRWRDEYGKRSVNASGRTKAAALQNLEAAIRGR